jgi:hypothetical protein
VNTVTNLVFLSCGSIGSAFAYIAGRRGSIPSKSIFVESG